MPAAASCPNCGSRLTRRGRFCPECGARVRVEEGDTVVQELPPDETGPVPIALATATPRFFGVTPPSAVLALGAASLALGIALLVSGHVVVGGALLGVSLVLFVFFLRLVREVPDAAVSRLSSVAAEAVRARAGFAVESLAAHSGARVELFRLRRELTELTARRGELARALGEAVYADDAETSRSVREQMAELDDVIAAKEEEMERTAAGAMERIQRARLQVQPTQIEPPPPVPEPFPEPSPPPEPVPIPEPTPEPSEPPGPTRVPEPGPVPSPPPRGE